MCILVDLEDTIPDPEEIFQQGSSAIRLLPGWEDIAVYGQHPKGHWPTERSSHYNSPFQCQTQCPGHRVQRGASHACGSGFR